MHPTIRAALPEIAALCERLGVRRLDLFGSGTDATFDPGSSDVDVLVEFDPDEVVDWFDTWFALTEGLEAILGRSVDLVSHRSVRNPYFVREVERRREQLYAA